MANFLHQEKQRQGFLKVPFLFQFCSLHINDAPTVPVTHLDLSMDNTSIYMIEKY